MITLSRIQSSEVPRVAERTFTRLKSKNYLTTLSLTAHLLQSMVSLRLIRTLI